MQKSKSLTLPTIGEFEFILTPVSVWFQSEEQFPEMRLYIEKGMQIIGKVNEKVQCPKKKVSEKKFFFKADILNRKSFRIFNQLNLSYQLSLYQVQNDGSQNFYDTIQFSLVKPWKEYSNWYENKINQFGSQIKEKDNERIAEKWKQLKKTAEHKQFKYTLSHQKRKIQIEFKFEIRSQYDDILDEYQKQKQRKLREKQQRMFMRSTLIPKYAVDPTESKFMKNQLSKTSLNYGQQDQTDFSKDIQNFRAKAQNRGQNHHVSFSPEETTSSEEKKSKAKISNKHSDESSEMLKNQSNILSEIKQDNEDHAHSDQSKKKQDKQLENIELLIEQREDEMPLIRVQSNTEKLDEKGSQKPQINTQIHSQTPKQNKVDVREEKLTKSINLKVIILYVVATIIMLFLVYHLMKPNKKM